MTKTGPGLHCSSLSLVSHTHEAWSQVEASPSNLQLMTLGLDSHDCMELHDIRTLLSMGLINAVLNPVLNITEMREGILLQMSLCTVLTF